MPDESIFRYRPELQFRRPYEGQEIERPAGLPGLPELVRPDLAELATKTVAGTLRRLARAAQEVEDLSRQICDCYATHPAFLEQVQAAERNDGVALLLSMKQLAQDPAAPGPLEMLPILRRGQAHLDAMAALVISQLPLYPAQPVDPEEAMRRWHAGEPVLQGEPLVASSASGGRTPILSVVLDRKNWRIDDIIEQVAEAELEGIRSIVGGRVADINRLWTMGFMPRLVILDAADKVADAWSSGVAALRRQWSMTTLDFWAGCQPEELARLIQQLPLGVLAAMREMLLQQLRELANAAERLRQLLALLDITSLIQMLKAMTTMNMQPLIDYLMDLKEIRPCLERAFQDVVDTWHYASNITKNTAKDIQQFGRFYQSRLSAMIENHGQREAAKAKIQAVSAVLSGDGVRADRLASPLYPCVVNAPA